MLLDTTLGAVFDVMFGVSQTLGIGGRVLGEEAVSLLLLLDIKPWVSSEYFSGGLRDRPSGVCTLGEYSIPGAVGKVGWNDPDGDSVI